MTKLSDLYGGKYPELDDLTDVNISSPSDGEVLTYNNGQWVNAEDGFKKVAEINVSSNTTYVEFTGLSGSNGDIYVIFFNLINHTSTTAYLGICINGDTTSTNYYRSSLIVNNTSVSSLRSNDHRAIPIGSDDRKTFGISYISLNNNDYSYLAHLVYGIPSEVRQFYTMVKYTSSVTSITSLKIQSNVTNGIGSGSKIRLYKMI